MALANNGCQTLTGWAWVPGSCTVIYTDENGAPNPIDFGQVLASKLTPASPSTFDYSPSTHTVTHNGSPYQLNCGAFGFNPNTCELTYVDEKGNSVAYFIPQDQYVLSADGCSLTILPAKGGSVTVPLGVPASQVSMALIDGKILEFNYKDKKCQIQLPNGIIGCEYTRASNSLALLFCDGQEKNIDFAKASLNCLVNPDGSQVISFNDGCSPALKQFNIPAVVLDTDNGNFDIASGILTINFGGDGNSGSVTMDVCDTVRRLCPATFTQINPDGSWSFMNTAGEIQNYPAPPNCKTHHASSPDLLDEANPPAVPTNPPATKSDGDTLVEHHPNGVAWFQCVGGSWQYNFMHSTDGNCCTTLATAGTPIDAANPPTQPENPPATKADKDTHIECHDNGWCGFTCVSGQWVRNFCKVIPRMVVTSDDGTIAVTPTTDANGVTTFDISCPGKGCCHYHTESTTSFDPANPPQVPSNPPATKNVGDTAVTKHPNGLCFYSCVAAGWILNYCCPIPEAFVATDPSKETFKAGDTIPATKNDIAICRLVEGVKVFEVLPTGSTVAPSDMLGCLQVDETDSTAAYFPPHEAQQQIVFEEGDTLPLDMKGAVTVCIDGLLNDDVENVGIIQAPFSAGGQLPQGMLGCVVVDPLTRCPCYSPAKPEQELYCGGETLPLSFVSTVAVNGLSYTGGDTLPLNTDSCLVYDEVSRNMRCLPNNGVAQIQCVQSGPFTPGELRLSSLEIEYCAGNKTLVSVCNAVRSAFRGVTNVDSSTPVGPLAGSEICVPGSLLTQPCGVCQISLTYNYGWNSFNGWETNLNQAFNSNPQYSTDGGATWTFFNSGGVDSVFQQSNGGNLVQGEFAFHDVANPVLQPATSYEICYRMFIVSNPTTAGVIQLQAQSANALFPQLACCAA